MSKTVKHCISVIAFLVMLIGAVKLLDYLLVPMNRADFFLHDMERMKKKGPNVDLIIIGNSHYLYGFDPVIFEEVLDVDNAYNASVTGLEISSKFYITEAMINDFEPKAVVFDIDWISLYDRGLDITQSKLLGLDRLRGISKIRHIVNDFYPSEMIYAVLRPYRYRDRLFWEGAVSGNVKLKRWAQSTRYSIDYYQTSKGYDKGMSCYGQQFDASSKGSFDVSLIWEHSKQYLDRIVELCKSRDIPLFLVTSPISTAQQMNIGNYQGAVDYYTSYAAEKGVHYFDMNMLKQRDEIFDETKMSDAGHLCADGASIASRICAEIIRDELNGIDTSDRFYVSMDELAADIKRLVAVGAEVSPGDHKIHVDNVRYTAGTDAEVKLDIQLSKNGQDYVTKFQTNHSGESFEIPAEGISSGTACIRIIGRDAVSGTETSADYTVTLTE